jgi:hypothetical protein
MVHLSYVNFSQKIILKNGQLKDLSISSKVTYDMISNTHMKITNRYQRNIKPSKIPLSLTRISETKKIYRVHFVGEYINELTF